MTTTESYRDYTVTYSALEQGDGRYTWEYQIAGDQRSNSRGRSYASAEAAISDARGQATARIDQLIWQDTRAS